MFPPLRVLVGFLLLKNTNCFLVNPHWSYVLNLWGFVACVLFSLSSSLLHRSPSPAFAEWSGDGRWKMMTPLLVLGFLPLRQASSRDFVWRISCAIPTTRPSLENTSISSPARMEVRSSLLTLDFMFLLISLYICFLIDGLNFIWVFSYCL